MPAIAGAEAVLENTGRLVQAAGRLGVGVAATEQNPEGLGRTVGVVADLLPTPAVAKTSFAADPGVAGHDPRNRRSAARRCNAASADDTAGSSMCPATSMWNR